MSIELIPGFGAFTPSTSGLLDGSESDGTQLLAGDAGLTSGWTTNFTSTVTGATTAPDGSSDALSLREGNTDNRHILFQQRTSVFSANSILGISVYAKQAARRYMQIIIISGNGTAGNVYAYYDLQTGTVTDSGTTGGAQSVTNTSCDAAVNGFYKCYARMRLSATTDDVYVAFGLSDAATYGSPLEDDSPRYLGDGSSNIYLWRPKLVVV